MDDLQDSDEFLDFFLVLFEERSWEHIRPEGVPFPERDLEVYRFRLVILRRIFTHVVERVLKDG